jgi:hypothetical protein
MRKLILIKHAMPDIDDSIEETILKEDKYGEFI